MLEPPETAAQRFWHTVAGAMLRLVGLALTVLFVLAAAVMTMDLWAWQRAEATSGWSYVLAMLGPLALLLSYWLLVRSRIVNQVIPAGESDMPVLPPEERRTDLVRPGFFEGNPDVLALRRLHVAAGLATVAVLGFAPAAVRGESFGLGAFRVAVGLLVLVAVVVGTLGDPERSGSTTWQPPARGSLVDRYRAWTPVLAFLLAAVGGVAVLAAMIHIGTAIQPDAPRRLHYPGIDWASYYVMLLAVGAVAVLAVANAVLAHLRQHSDARSRRAFRPYARGMGCTLVVALGVFLGVGYVGAFTTALAATMNAGRRAEGRAAAEVPELLARTVYAWGITAICLVGLAVVAWVGLRRNKRKLEHYARADLERTDGDARRLHVPSRWLRKIGVAIWTARLKNRAAAVATALVLVGMVLTAVVLYELAPQLTGLASWPRLGGRAGEAPGWLALLSASPTWPEDLTGNPAVLRDALIAIGTISLTALATTLLALGRTALLGESTRRGVNVVWDVISFWPRSAHPFVPAAYSQRAVADLEERIREHLRPGGCDTVVLCGHSQGRLLSFAALQRLAATDAALLERIGLVTFGSQLQVMFSRGFPAYVNHDAITGLWTALDGRWRNLYRDTDHLAGPVLSWGHRKDPALLGWLGDTGTVLPLRVLDREENGPDWRLTDPPVPEHADLHRAVLLPLRRHGGYWLDPAWEAAVDAVRPGIVARQVIVEPRSTGRHAMTTPVVLHP